MILLHRMSENFLPMFLSRTFMVLQLIFKSFILKFVLVYGISWWSSFIFFMLLSRSPKTICWRDYFCFILCFCPLCQILIDHRDLGLYLGSLFCFNDLCVYPCTSNRLFWLLWLCNIDLCQVWWCLLFCSFFCKIVEAIWNCLWFHIIFWNVCFISVKYVMGTLIGIALNL